MKSLSKQVVVVMMVRHGHGVRLTSDPSISSSSIQSRQQTDLLPQVPDEFPVLFLRFCTDAVAATHVESTFTV
jgi:hypothetical protein